MLIVVKETGLDALGVALKKSIKAFIPGSIDGTRPQDEERKLMGVGQGQFLPQQFAFPIGRDRFARVGFLFLPTAPTRTCCCLARKIDKFFETGIIFDAGLDKVLRTQGIHFEIGFFIDGRYRTREMKHLIDVFYTLF
jgi:hypothetical protein